MHWHWEKKKICRICGKTQKKECSELPSVTSWFLYAHDAIVGRVEAFFSKGGPYYGNTHGHRTGPVSALDECKREVEAHVAGQLDGINRDLDKAMKTGGDSDAE